jgi:hypothetical protein
MEVINGARKTLLKGEHIKDVDVCSPDRSASWSVSVLLNATANTVSTESLLKEVKDAFLAGSQASKHAYVLGYCSPKAFSDLPGGFELNIGVMEHPAYACWHIFKKGFCRHNTECVKQHPAARIAVRVLIEHVDYVPECQPCIVNEFERDVLVLAKKVKTALEEAAYVQKCETIGNDEGEGWTLEVSVDDSDLKKTKDYLIMVAKNAIFGATSTSKNIYILSYAAQPFQCRQHGFLTLLGDMPDDSKACWDFYSKGVCGRALEGVCRLQHPRCTAPLKVVIKSESES